MTEGGYSNMTEDSSYASGSLVLRPVFLGNLYAEYTAEDVISMFERPAQPPKADRQYKGMPVDRIDFKRGYCFVFLKDAVSQEDKEEAESYVVDINGMEVPGVSRAVRAEFARGDGRIKKKEDERRQKIEPSDTLFVVNFNERTTARDDLRYLFKPFGNLLRIDMKHNYAFIQFESIEQATRAKESTDGGRFDKSILTVEYVARQRAGSSERDRGRGLPGPRGGRDRYDDKRRGPPPPPMNDMDRDRRYGRGPPPVPSRHDDYRSRGRDRISPPGYPGGRRSRSRSPSPRYGGGGYRGGGSRRSPPRRHDDRYDDYRPHGGSSDFRGRGRGDMSSSGGGGPPPPRRADSQSYRDAGIGIRRSPDADFFRGERGYRA